MAYPASYGKYLLIDKIAKGGMAEVFLAKQTGSKGFERLLAIKRILPQFTENAEFVSMFINEAKVAAQLSHPNIVQIYDFGEVEESFYIGMEYVMGKDLRTLMEKGQKSGAPLPLDQILLIVSRVCSGLEHAHKKKDLHGNSLSLVHRDVSPQNILISYDGEVKLVDFGIAKAALQETETRTGILKGKLAYMSPEQAWGKPIDHRSDLFSLGIVLYECVTGKRLFKGDSEINTLERVREAKFDPPRQYNAQVTPQVESVLVKALAKEVQGRYPSAAQMQGDLERALSKSLSEIQSDLAQTLRKLFTEDIAKDETRMRKAAVAAPEPTPVGGAAAASQAQTSQPSISPPKLEMPEKKVGAMVWSTLSVVGALALIGIGTVVFLKRGDESEQLASRTPLTIHEQPQSPPVVPVSPPPPAEKTEEKPFPPTPAPEAAPHLNAAPPAITQKKESPSIKSKKTPSAAARRSVEPPLSGPKETPQTRQEPVREASLPPAETFVPPVEKTSPKPPVFSDEEQIRRIVRRQEQALEDKNISLYLKDLVASSPGQEKDLQKFFDQYENISVQFDISDLQIEGNRASLLMKQETRLKPKKSSKIQNSEAKVSWGLIKEGDIWKISETKILQK